MTDAAALNDALAANYMLVELRIRSWSGKSTDRGASQEVLANKHATADGGSFVKNLLAGAKQELKEVHTMDGALREFVYNRTLAWSNTQGDDGARRGARLLPAATAMEFLVEVNNLKKERDRAVLQLQSVWKQRVVEAMQNLGGLADSGDYPDEAAIPSLFAASVDLRPVPATSDFSRINVPGPLAGALAQRGAEQAKVMIDNAMKEMQDRFVEELTRIHTQMSKHANGEKTRLYGSLITNMQSLVGMARNMNLNQNPKLDELVAKIEAKLLAAPIEAYRDDPLKAKAAATEAQQILAEVQLPDVW